MFTLCFHEVDEVKAYWGGSCSSVCPSSFCIQNQLHDFGKIWYGVYFEISYRIFPWSISAHTLREVSVLLY